MAVNKLNSKRPPYWSLCSGILAVLVLVLLAPVGGCASLVRQPHEAQSNQFRKYAASDIERIFKAHKLPVGKFSEFKPWIKAMRPRAQYKNERIFFFIFATAKGRRGAQLREYAVKRTMDRFIKIARKRQSVARPRNRDYLLIKDNIVVIIGNYNNSVPAAEVEKYRRALESLH